MKIRIGTRGSKLARWQAEWVAAELKKRDVETELVFLKTLGDVTSGPIGNVGGLGVFTKEIQRALLDNNVDLAVHSLKDLPTESVDGLTLAAVPPRESSGDAFIAKSVRSLDELPKAAIIGTGSARRRAQLLAWRNDLDVRDLRGNIETRLQKLADEKMDAIVLAESGLRRLQLESHITQVIPKTIMLPAVGQGALGLETREDDVGTREALTSLHDATTYRCVVAERAMLFALRGGCLAPVGAWTREEDGTLFLDGVVLNAAGTRKVTVSVSTSEGTDDPQALGTLAAERLLAQGAAELLERN